MFRFILGDKPEESFGGLKNSLQSEKRSVEKRVKKRGKKIVTN